jgi:molybdopterin synthase catalytic subunit
MSKKAKKEYYKANFNLIKYLRQNQPFSKKKITAKKEDYKTKPSNIKHLHYSFFGPSFV